MENIELSLLVISIIVLLLTLDVLIMSIQSLIKKKGIFCIYEKMIVSLLGIFFGKKYAEKINEKKLGGNKWKVRGISGLLTGLLCLYMGIIMLYAAIWQ